MYQELYCVVFAVLWVLFGSPHNRLDISFQVMNLRFIEFK